MTRSAQGRGKRLSALDLIVHVIIIFYKCCFHDCR